MMSDMGEMPIADVKVGDRIREDVGDLASLKESIEARGQLQPIVLDTSGNLIAGYRRLNACDELEHETILYVVASNLKTAADKLHAERDENECRVEFTPAEKVKLGLRLEDMENPAPASRKKKTQAKKGEKAANESHKERTQGGAKLAPPCENGKTRDRVAAAVGMSKMTYTKAKEVVEAAEEHPDDEKIQAAFKAMNRTGKVSGAHTKVMAALYPSSNEYCLAENVSKVEDYITARLKESPERDKLMLIKLVEKIVEKKIKEVSK